VGQNHPTGMAKRDKIIPLECKKWDKIIPQDYNKTGQNHPTGASSLD